MKFHGRLNDYMVDHYNSSGAVNDGGGNHFRTSSLSQKLFCNPDFTTPFIITFTKKSQGLCFWTANLDPLTDCISHVIQCLHCRASRLGPHKSRSTIRWDPGGWRRSDIPRHWDYPPGHDIRNQIRGEARNRCVIRAWVTDIRWTTCAVGNGGIGRTVQIDFSACRPDESKRVAKGSDQAATSLRGMGGGSQGRGFAPWVDLAVILGHLASLYWFEALKTVKLPNKLSK